MVFELEDIQKRVDREYFLMFVLTWRSQRVVFVCVCICFILLFAIVSAVYTLEVKHFRDEAAFSFDTPSRPTAKKPFYPLGQDVFFSWFVNSFFF